MKKFSMKMKFFVFSLIFIEINILLGFFIMKSENIIIAGMWGIVTLCGIATGGKAADDFQRGMFFKSELKEGKDE